MRRLSLTVLLNTFWTVKQGACVMELSAITGFGPICVTVGKTTAELTWVCMP